VLVEVGALTAVTVYMFSASKLVCSPKYTRSPFCNEVTVVLVETKFDPRVTPTVFEEDRGDFTAISAMVAQVPLPLQSLGQDV
jgi:hypothetical protein